MAWFKKNLLLSLFSLLLFSHSLCAALKSATFVLPVKKDGATLQYVTRVQQRTPPTLLNLVVDLGARYLWVDCDKGYVSSTYGSVYCGTAECNLTASQGCTDCSLPRRPGCDKNTCSVGIEGPTVGTGGVLAQDALSIASTNGTVPGPSATIPKFVFSCAPSFLLKGLARGAKGMLGLGRGNLGLPLQLASAFPVSAKFAVCLSSTTTSNGVMFFGDGPYEISSGVDASARFKYTPLFVNPVSTAGSYIAGEESVEYFIGVRSVKVNGTAVPLKKSLLSIDEEGHGGTKISTTAPYTQLQTSIYTAVTGAFATAMGSTTRVAPVGKLKLCYDAKDVGARYTGPAVPTIDLVLQDESVYWSILGANSMVEAKKGVLCLAFVDGGINPTTSIVIGGHQIEDNLLQFDIANSRLGFTSSLWIVKTTCASYNFQSLP
ncbi:basic 7S globulin-like [Iris pallida]|uniref:Basic 7S globulin-like n=1 Tax=Iris pallida TaxID=29817 RepID=A0AAX6G439_IRIPA|nr:basic 7S globulin-like [Iris pallida]